jgi:hypothetical protein
MSFLIQFVLMPLLLSLLVGGGFHAFIYWGLPYLLGRRVPPVLPPPIAPIPAEARWIPDEETLRKQAILERIKRVGVSPATVGTGIHRYN